MADTGAVIVKAANRCLACVRMFAHSVPDPIVAAIALLTEQQSAPLDSSPT